MRGIKIPKFKPPRPRHAASATRKPTPPARPRPRPLPAHRLGDRDRWDDAPVRRPATRDTSPVRSHRGKPAPQVPKGPQHLNRRAAGLSIGPKKTSAPSPRGRFATGGPSMGTTPSDRVADERVRYTRGQQLADATRRHAGGRTGAPGNPRARFTEQTSAQKNRTAKQLHPTAAKATGRAARPASPLRNPHADPAAKRTTARHTADPQPQLSGRGFAGSYFGERKAR